MNRLKKLIPGFVFLFVPFFILAQPIEIPVIQNITVDRLSQKVFIKWSINHPELVDGYIVKRQIFNQPGVVDGTFNTVATINDRNQMTYLDVSTDYGTSEPGAKLETYRIAAFRLNGADIEYSNMSNPLSTIYLQPVAFDLCHEHNTLKWTAYKGFGNNLTGYRVYYAETAAGLPNFLAELPKSDTVFIHRQVASNFQYFYFVTAFSSTNADTSMSNVHGSTTFMPPVPTIMNADFGTVENDGQIKVSFSVDPIAEVSMYKLLKSNSIDGVWDSIANFPRGSSTILSAQNANTSKETVYFKVVSINACKIVSRESNLAHNIVLEAVVNSSNQFTNSLSWKPYTGWPVGVELYRVFRSIDGAEFEQIAELQSNILSYTDDIEQFVKPEIGNVPTKGQFCYYVEAVEGDGNPYGIKGMSKSNISCAWQPAVAYIPNAFNPNSQIDENRTFKPVISFVNDYQLIIYNRWGDVVFKSNDPLQGWDGTIKGRLLPKATYVYVLKYRTKDNQLIEKSGHVNLVY